MSDFPEFSNYGYQITEPLGRNYQGGRVAYKTIKIDNKQPVVIKQFKFATRHNINYLDKYKSKFQNARIYSPRTIFSLSHLD
ncbi:MAG: hypothetical protein AB4426_31740 [Xenococcaceae cyanobacterium]